MTTASVLPPAQDRPAPGVPSAVPPPIRRRTGPIAALRRNFDRYWYAWAMIAPVVIVLGVLVFYPLGRGIYLSLTDINELNAGRTIGVNHIPATFRFVGLQNYVDVLSGRDGSFYPRLVWTVEWTLACVVCQVGIGLGLAVMLNRSMRFRSVYRMLLILPWAVPAFVAAFSWRLILNGDGGVLNAILGAVGVHGVDWLGQPFAAKVSVIMVNIWLGVPFNLVAVLGGLQAIPQDLYEAAEVDGASAWQRFRVITLPGLRPVSGTIVLLGVIWTFNQFPVIALVTGGGPGGATDILVTHAYNIAFKGIDDYSGAATNGAIILSILVVFAGVYRRFLNRPAMEVAT
jgi:arabinogalactan oligomer/maltooligosaccharide transport system permease protein